MLFFVIASALLGFTQVSNIPEAFAQGGGGGGVIPPSTAVGGEIIPLDTILVLGYSILNSYWMAPVVVGIGIGIYLVKRKF